MVAKMKSTARMLGGFKAHRTMLLNQLRDRAWDKLWEIGKNESKWLPTIANMPNGGVELCYDLGGGLRELKFVSRDEARGFVLSLFCCGEQY